MKLVEIIGYKEGLPVVTDPGILSPKKFIDEVLQIQTEGAQKRQEAEQELRRIEGELKQKLLETRKVSK